MTYELYSLILLWILTALWFVAGICCYRWLRDLPNRRVKINGFMDFLLCLMFWPIPVIAFAVESGKLKAKIKYEAPKLENRKTPMELGIYEN